MFVIQVRTSSTRVATAPVRVSVVSVPTQPPIHDLLVTASSSCLPPVSRRIGPPESPWQITASPTAVSETFAEASPVAVNDAVCSRSGTQAVFVRPNPAAVTLSSAVAGAAARATGFTFAMPTPSFTMTRSRSGCGTSSTAVRTAPPVVWVRSTRPTVTVVVTLGLPGWTAPVASAKQLAAERTHRGFTSVPVQERSEVPTTILAVWPKDAASAGAPCRAMAGAATKLPARVAATATPPVQNLRPCICDTTISPTGMRR